MEINRDWLLVFAVFTSGKDDHSRPIQLSRNSINFFFLHNSPPEKAAWWEISKLTPKWTTTNYTRKRAPLLSPLTYTITKRGCPQDIPNYFLVNNFILKYLQQMMHSFNYRHFDTIIIYTRQNDQRSTYYLARLIKMFKFFPPLC